MLVALLPFTVATNSHGQIVWTSGDLGNNVVEDAGAYFVFPELEDPSNVMPATLTVKYGLWNTPTVLVDVMVNSTFVGSFEADQGYLSPGPEVADFDVTGLLFNGGNTVLFTGNGVNDGDYVVGQVDLAYFQVPEPGLAVFAVPLLGWSLQRSRRNLHYSS